MSKVLANIDFEFGALFFLILNSMHSNSNHFALDFITVVCGLHEFIRLVRLEYMLFSMEAPIIFTI